jgi:hypothetical protein
MRSSFFALALAITGALMVGCGGSGGGDDTGDDTATADAPPATGGTAQLAFSVTNGVRQSPNLQDPLSGAVYGQIFRQEDVTITGPLEGATEYGYVEVLAVDLTSAQTAGAWTSPDLPPEDYVFLGFYDVDGNGATDRSPDSGDPVTLPVTNQFTVTTGQTTTVTVEFDLVYN